MYAVSTFLARRKPETQRNYKRSLERFAKHIGYTLDTLHKYLELTPREQLTGDLLTFADSLKKLNQNTQRNIVASVMSYIGYNDITIAKAQRSQVLPKKGDVFRDKAMSALEVRKVYEYLPPVGRMALLLLFSTGMRIGELVQITERDVEGKIIHLKGAYTKNSRERDVVMSQECTDFLNTIWLPQKQEYLRQAQNKNAGLLKVNAGLSRKLGVKSVDDNRIIPTCQATMYQILVGGFKAAGFSEKKDGKNLYHPHGLRKSFRSIVGSQSPDLAETLMGHEGYLSANYVRLDLVKEYEKVEHLLSLNGNAGTQNRIAELEATVAEQQKELAELKSLKSELIMLVAEMSKSKRPDKYPQ